MFRTLICPSSGACDCDGGLALVLQPAKRTPPNIIRSKPQHTTIREQDNRCGNPSTHSQAPEDGHINVRNMLSK